jgi:hypothetical protein
MTHMSLLVIGAVESQLDAVLDPFLKNPKDKRYAVFYSMDEEIREMYELGMIQPYDAPKGSLVPVRERYNNDFDAFVAGQYPYAEKNEDGIYGQYENPNGKYSYYVIGGRNSGFFQLCKGGLGTLTKRNSRYDPIPDSNTADITQLKYWDRELQAQIQCERAVARHRYFYAHLGSIELPLSDEDGRHFLKDNSPLHGYDLTSIYTQKEAEYSAMAAMRANVTYAVFKDGVIYERKFEGRAGAPGEIDEFRSWHQTFLSLLEGVDADTPLIALTAYE